jgi:hypothetical protein
MNRLAKFARLSWPDRLLFLEAALWLGIARLAILLIPFRWIALLLGKHMAESPVSMEPTHRSLAEHVSWAIRTASRHVPWKSRCLVQAMAVKGMLRLRGIPSTIYMGLAKDEDDNLKAHAWLRSGDMVVVGTPGVDRFSVVSTFSEEL